jgi:hypothetical protein
MFKNIKELAMRPAIIGIMIGISTALSLKNQKSLTSSVVRASLASELMTIIIFGLIEIN